MAEQISNLVEMVDSVVPHFSQRVCLIFGAKKITYGELSTYSKKLAQGLYTLGVRQNDKVALWLSNCPEFVYSFFAVLRLGATVVPINTMFKREEAKFVVEDSGAKILICPIEKADDCQNILSRLDILEYVVCNPFPHKNPSFRDFYSLIQDAPEFSSSVNIAQDSIAELVYTSGTTGRPKGACLSHKNLLSNTKDCAESIKATKRDCFLCVLPLFHSFASTVCMLLPLSVGARIVIMRAVRPFKRVIRSIFKRKVTVFTGVPSLYSILSEAKFPRFALFASYVMNPIRLCISGAAALPYNVWKKFEKKFRRPLLQGYGLTEASPVVSLNPLRGKRKPESVGVCIPSMSAKIIDSDGRQLKEGEVGELLVQGPNVMKSYHHAEEETKKVLRDGWLYTGDLAKIDEDGFIYIMGRLKEMINVRGMNVYPREIEDVLYRHPQVREAAVVGTTHRHRGEVPVAFLVKEGELSSKDVIDYLRVNVAAYKVPLKIVFKETLPKNPTGKILKRELQKEVEGAFK
ncbi:MAG: long-chain fatty acid--CoA ligase [Candidatus Omnitrophota bacterium]|nr:MAG: long-chain fatty acid--CoA ligase [Candidatus Omnitrophota bacterium]